MPEIKHSNAADLMPAKLFLSEYMSPKKVANVFASQNIPLDIIGQSDLYLPFSNLCGLYERAARSLGEPNFGVYCGAQWSHELIGPLSEYATAAPNLKQCLHRLIAAVHMYESGASGSLTREGELVKLSYYIGWEHPIGRQHVTNASVGFILDVIRYYTGKGWLPNRIETDSRKVSHSTFLEEFIEVPVESGKTAISFIFAAKDLNTPNPYQGSAFADYTLSDLGVLMDEPPPSSMVDVVSQVVRMRLLGSMIDIDGAAHQLNLGVRSMQRRLSVEGESYRNILVRERISRATDLLLEKDSSITKIAMLLGYEYVGDFTRAFTKATGYPPSAIHQTK